MERLAQFIIGLSGDPIWGRWLVMVLFGGAVFALALAFYFLVFGMYNALAVITQFFARSFPDYKVIAQLVSRVPEESVFMFGTGKIA